MASQIVNRLQQQRSNIRRMLLPGLHPARIGEQSSAPLSPVQDGIGGAKYQLAARRMRSLDPDRMGLASSESLQTFSREIIQKFQSPEPLLHLAPPSAEPSGVWSAVETIFPVQSRGTREAPPQPGEMRAGSIIPPMPMFPKPGQNIESFKEQIRQRPQAPAKPVEPPRPRIEPKTRLFSRVQEIPAKKPGQDDQPDIPETIQRQPDMPQPPQHKPDVEPTLPPALPPAVNAPEPETSQFTPPALPQESTIEQAAPPSALPPAPEQDHPAAVQLPVERKTLEKAQPAKPVDGPVPPHVEQILKKAIPVHQQPKRDKPTADLPRALSVSRSEQKGKTPSQPVIPAKQDAAEATAKPAPAQQPLLESRKAAVPSVGEEKHLPVAEPEPPVEAEPLSTELRSVRPTENEPPGGQPPIETAPARQLADSLQPETPASTPSAEGMPLQKQVVSRRKSVAKLKTVTPQRVEPHLNVSTSLHIEKPLLSIQKYRSTSNVVARQPDESNPALSSSQPDALQQLLEYLQPAPKSQGAEQKPGVGQQQPASTPAEMSPIPLSLVYPPRPASPAQQPQPAPQTTTPTSQPPLSQPVAQKTATPVAPTVRPANVRNTIQRRWPEHPEPGDHTVSSGAGGASGGEQTGASAPNLDQLAEDVFPYIKRLIENESDRLSSRFH